MIHVLISRYELSEYLFSNLDGIDTIFVPVRKHNSLPHRLVKAIYYKVCPKVYSNYLPQDVSDRLKAIPQNDTLIVIGEDTYFYWVLSHLCKHVKHKVAYFWNSCVSAKKQKTCTIIKKNENRAKAIVEYVRSLGFTMATFDSADAEKYSMEYFPQFYRLYPDGNCLKENTKYDFFFCGRDKGRKGQICKIQERLSKYGICNFIVIPGKSPDAIGYFDYLDVLKESKVICEFVQDGQIGLTIRTLEALFFHKKLITTNSSIIDEDFYNQKNILIIKEQTSDEELRNFLNCPMSAVDVSIIQKYGVYSLLNFLNTKCHEGL